MLFLNIYTGTGNFIPITVSTEFTKYESTW